MNGKIRIERDPNPSNPRTESDNFGHMVCFHKRYRLGDKHELKESMFGGWDQLHDHLVNECNAAVVLPIFMMDHSGITIRSKTSDFAAADPQGWDWGQIGFIYVTDAEIKANFGDSVSGPELLKKVTEILLSEIEVYDSYLRGDVYGYVIEDPVVDPDSGEHLEDEYEESDSCWGFYGYDIEKNGIKDAVKEWLDKGYEIVRD